MILIHTLADCVSAVESGIDRCLIEEQYLRKIKRMTRQFPARLDGIFGFETHLSEVTGRADFAFRIANEEPAKELLEAVLTEAEASAADKNWRSLRTFSTLWLDRDSRFNRNLEDVWLEFDIDPNDSHLRSPSVFFTRRPLPTKGEYVAYFSEIIRHFQGTAVLNAIIRTVTACLDHLPPKASIPLLGLMLSRPVEAVRLTMARMTSDQIQTYLQGLDWPGDHRTLHEALGLAEGRAARIGLAVDAGSELSPKLGVEVHFSEDKLPRRPYPWEGILDALVARGLCLPAKRDAILRYPGLVEVQQDGLGCKSMLLKQISHLKIVIDSDRITAAKAYLEARQSQSRRHS